MGDITLKKALDDYRTVYMPYRNFAERTRVEYLNDLQDLIGFLEKAGINHVREMGLPIIKRYVAHLEVKGLASLTRKRKVVTIRSFLLFLYQDGYINKNIAKSVILPFVESTVPYILTQTECDQLRVACAGIPRDRAIIELLLQTGIKLSELTRVTLDDIDLGNSDELGKKGIAFVRVVGSRGKKERVIPLNERAVTAIRNYLHDRAKAGSNILFLSRFREPVSNRGVQKMLRKYLKRSRIERASIHTLRHTFAAYHLAKGTGLKTVQDLIGQKDRRSAAIYLSFVNTYI